MMVNVGNYTMVWDRQGEKHTPLPPWFWKANLNHLTYLHLDEWYYCTTHLQIPKPGFPPRTFSWWHNLSKWPPSPSSLWYPRFELSHQSYSSSDGRKEGVSVLKPQILKEEPRCGRQKVKSHSLEMVHVFPSQNGMLSASCKAMTRNVGATWY